MALALTGPGGLASVVIAAEATWPRPPSVEFDVEFDVDQADGLDQAGDVDRDVRTLQSDLGVDLRQAWTPNLDTRAELRLISTRVQGAADEDDDDDVGLFLERLHLDYEFGGPGGTLRVGRQPIDDPMSWIVDETLDGIRYRLPKGRWALDVSLTQQLAFEVLDDPEEPAIWNALLSVTVAASDASSWMPWLLHRSHQDNDDDVETSWLGLQGLVTLGDSVAYWVNLALRDGEQREEDATVELGGSAFDTGVSLRLDRRFAPTVSLGVARASGDTDPDDNEDRSFRQSGLHDNEHAPHGGNRFRYLGVVLDPELSNLDVLTVGIGARPAARWAVDLMYHHYRQVRRSDRLRGSDLDLSPDGRDLVLGNALDLIVGYEPDKAVEIEATLGLFDPGLAFDESADLAWRTGIELELEF